MLAVIATYLVGTLTYGQLNLAPLVEMGMPVDAGVRWQTAVHDVTSMYDLYLPLVTIALLLGFLGAGPVLRFVPQLRTLGYVSGGFVAILVLDFALSAAFTTHPLAVTRTFVGLMSQCLAGAVGGYVFVRLVPGEPTASGEASA